MSAADLVQAAIAFLGLILGGGVVVTKLLNRRVDDATARKTEVEAVTEWAAAVRLDNEALRDARDAERARAEHLAAENREQAVLVAEHAVWDVKAYARLAQTDPDFPPPTPLYPTRED